MSLVSNELYSDAFDHSAFITCDNKYFLIV